MAGDLLDVLLREFKACLLLQKLLLVDDRLLILLFDSFELHVNLVEFLVNEGMLLVWLRSLSHAHS